MPSNHLILCHLLLFLLSVFPSIKVFSNESAHHMRWPKYLNFSFRISPSNEYSGLISSRMDWLDLFAVQGTLKSLLQHHSSKASILQHSTFFMVQLSHPYMTTGKTIALTIWTFVSKVMPRLWEVANNLSFSYESYGLRIILLLKKSSVAKFNSFSSQFHIYRREIILALWFMMCYWTSIYVKLMFQKAPVLNGICN